MFSTEKGEVRGLRIEDGLEKKNVADTGDGEEDDIVLVFSTNNLGLSFALCRVSS